jgi:hypothetical protein
VSHHAFLTDMRVMDEDGENRPIRFGTGAADSGAERLTPAERAAYAAAGETALAACFARFADAEKDAFWQAICRCYNRPYNPPADPIAGVLPDVGARAAAMVPPPHVIEAPRP